MLDTNLNYNVDWSLYDNWKWNYSTEEFDRTPDDTLDMMIIQHRHRDIFGQGYGGFAGVSVDYNTLQGGKRIDGSYYSYRGSGLTQLNGYGIPKESFVGLFRHEYCHFMLGDHRPYSTVAGQDGTNLAFGYELGLSPQDMISVGYANVTNYTGSTHSFTLNDMTTTGDVLKVPSTNSGEYFLVSNRQRVTGNGSYMWDCNMAGDTAMDNPFLQFKDYSKGLYIYHVTGGDNYDAFADLECADGLWNWGISGTSTPDWSASQVLPTFYKTGIGYNDDDPSTSVTGSTRMSSRDGQSLDDYTNSVGSGYHNKWFSIGKRHTALNGQGIDRSFTNLEENWCARENWGDRWDAWKKDYNEVYSPYSSPNTKDRSGNQTGIFVYLSNMASGVATVNVYQAAANSQEEVVILEATPPSKPMLFRPVEIVGCNGTFGYPKIIWDNNLEPDMVRTGLSSSFKRYYIYRAASDDFNTLVGSYSYCATYDDYSPNDPASFIDYQTIISCGFVNENERFYRYKVTAIDVHDSESVKSDFVSTQGASSTGGDMPFVNINEPLNFRLSQNYPNPFNPTTEIKFDLPQNTFVTLRVYNAVGQVVAELVNNEYRNAGSYSVSFDGSKLASGIYFYSIDAGVYHDVKKMVLLK